MDQAVALAKAYLEANGYFVVTEYPVLQYDDGWHIATDLDILAVRFARRTVSEGQERGLLANELDPELGVPDQMDMIVGEVKEGRASLNPAIRSPRVVQTALVRFGCCDVDEAGSIVASIAKSGIAVTRSGHQVRFVSFASRGTTSRAERVIKLGHAAEFLQNHLSQHWSAYRRAQINGGPLGFLHLLKKMEQGRLGTVNAKSTK